ncbi:MAG: nuclear transport factor 2 family protein [Rhizobacter sp.]|nr:nuclear transport factor 2 family protein [Chlorobiales bacterium]
MQTLTEELLTANQKFYEAFAELSIEKMDEVWLKSVYVKCLHPGWKAVSGGEAVMESWQLIFRNTGLMRFELTEVEATVLGRVGIVTLRERLVSSDPSAELVNRTTLAATNLFEFSDDGWKMIHHHAGPTEPDEPDFTTPGDDDSSEL